MSKTSNPFPLEGKTRSPRIALTLSEIISSLVIYYYLHKNYLNYFISGIVDFYCAADSIEVVFCSDDKRDVVSTVVLDSYYNF